MNILVIVIGTIAFLALAYCAFKLVVYAGDKVAVLSYHLIIWSQKTFQFGKNTGTEKKISQQN